MGFEARLARAVAAASVVMGGVLVAAVPAAASATLVADYQFNNSRSSSVGGAPALVDAGGPNSFVNDSVEGTAQPVLQFAAGDGVDLSPTAGVMPNGTYTIEVLASFDQQSGYTRIVDFKDSTSDNGLYTLNGQLDFYPWASGGTNPISPGTYARIVLTRDSVGMVRGYVDGVLQWTFDDSASEDGVIDASGLLRFFRDDTVVPDEVSAGKVARIRVWDDALDAGQVEGLEPNALRVGDVVVTEPSGGKTQAKVTFTLDHAESSDLTIHYSTLDDTATAPTDYKALTNKTKMIKAGKNTAQVTIPIYGGPTDEATNDFFVEALEATGPAVAIIRPVGTVTIRPADGGGTVSIGDVTVNEGDTKTQKATFTVTLSEPQATPVVVQYSTADVSATAPDDYKALTGKTKTIKAGKTTALISVTTYGDTTPEYDEQFQVQLTGATGAVIGSAVGTGTILDNDGSPPGI